MIKRTISPKLQELATYFPVVTILGPRQSGKTTLAKETFPNYSYANCENLAIRQVAQTDPNAFFELYPPPVIIDEVQRVPELLSHIQILADETTERGMFILTGSHQPKLHAHIAQSLAGRTGILKLLPLSISELTQANINLTRDEYILNGFMPRLYNEGIPPKLLYSSYFSTYIERDVRQLINVSNQNSFETFIKLLAGRVGQILNLNSLSNDIGVSSTTLSSWLSVLEASYIIYRLPCYFNNFGKRLTKAPKIYFTDVGLACHLLGINDKQQVHRDPLLGGLFENLVVIEALKTRYNLGEQPELYFYRANNRIEVDLILNNNRTLVPIEIKSSMTYNNSLANNLSLFTKIAENISHPTVIYAGDIETTVNGIRFDNFTNIAKIITS